MSIWFITITSICTAIMLYILPILCMILIGAYKGNLKLSFNKERLVRPRQENRKRNSFHASL